MCVAVRKEGFSRHPMADLNEPKEKTVRITLPPSPAISVPAANGGGLRPSSLSKPTPLAEVESLAPPTSEKPAGPKKETARIAVMLERGPATPTVRMSKTQPRITAPAASVKVAPRGPSAPLDSIPIPLCWALLGVSTVVFIVQVWTYFS